MHTSARLPVAGRLSVGPFLLHQWPPLPPPAHGHTHTHCGCMSLCMHNCSCELTTLSSDAEPHKPQECLLLHANLMPTYMFSLQTCALMVACCARVVACCVACWASCLARSAASLLISISAACCALVSQSMLMISCWECTGVCVGVGVCKGGGG